MPTLCSNAPRRRPKARLALLAAAVAGALLALPATATAASSTSWRAVYWNNTTMSGTPTLRQTQSTIGFNTTTATSIFPAVATTHWSAEYTAAPQFAAGTYQFTVTVDDGARLWVDGTLLVNQWVPESATTISPPPISLASGIHQVKLQYFQDSYAEVLSLGWTAVAAAAPSNMSLPVVIGAPQVGSLLTTGTGAWNNRPSGYAYQWQRDQANIAGATAASYTVVSADVNHRIDVAVTASNSVGSASAMSASTSAVVTGTGANALDTVIADVSLPNEGYPHGVPSSYSFYNGPELDNPLPPGGMSAATSWGVIYEAAEGSPAVNTRVEVRDEELWLWSNSRKAWVEYQASLAPAGSDYYEPTGGPFANQSYAANLRTEADGGISVKMDHGAWFHFWPAQGRVSIAPSDIGGVFTTFQSRLVVDDPSKPDDTASARYLASAGSDWWATLDAPWPDNNQVFYDRFVYITPSWQSFYGASWSPAQLRQNPPPVAAGT